MKYWKVVRTIEEVFEVYGHSLKDAERSLAEDGDPARINVLNEEWTEIIEPALKGEE